MHFSDIAEALDEFAAARGWQKHHLPRSVMLALVKEVGELTELLQWVPDGDVEEWLKSESNRDKVAEEVADIFIYLHYFARAAQIDLPAAISRKLTKNEQKYPPHEGGQLCP